MARWLFRAVVILVAIILAVTGVVIAVVETGWGKDQLRGLVVRQANQYLKPGVSFATLDRIAGATSDNQAADQLQKARQKLFNTIHGRDLRTG